MVVASAACSMIVRMLGLLASGVPRFGSPPVLHASVLAPLVFQAIDAQVAA